MPSASTGSRLLKIDPKAAAAHRAWSDLCGSWASGEQTAQPRRALPADHWVCQKSGRNPTLGSSPCACRCLSIQFHRLASSDRRQRNPGPAVGLGKSAVSFRIAFVPRLISLALRVATKYDDIAVGCGGDRSRGFGAFSAIFRSLARAFALHPAKDFFRKSGVTDRARQILTSTAAMPSLPPYLVHLRADLDHEIGAFVAHDFGHVRVAQHPPISLQLFEAMRYAAQESLTATPVARMRLSCTPVSSTGTIPSVS